MSSILSARQRCRVGAATDDPLGRHLAYLIFQGFVSPWECLIWRRVRHGKGGINVARNKAARSRETIRLKHFNGVGLPEDLSAEVHQPMYRSKGR